MNTLLIIFATSFWLKGVVAQLTSKTFSIAVDESLSTTFIDLEMEGDAIALNPVYATSTVTVTSAILGADLVVAEEGILSVQDTPASDTTGDFQTDFPISNSVMGGNELFAAWFDGLFLGDAIDCDTILFLDHSKY